MDAIDNFLEPAHKYLETIKSHVLIAKQKMTLREHQHNARELKQVFEDLEEWVRSTGRTFR